MNHRPGMESIVGHLGVVLGMALRSKTPWVTVDQATTTLNVHRRYARRLLEALVMVGVFERTRDWRPGGSEPIHFGFSPLFRRAMRIVSMQAEGQPGNRPAEGLMPQQQGRTSP